jgi:5S rRNA maturation endonuclease (ribonuclease M5)
VFRFGDPARVGWANALYMTSRRAKHSSIHPDQKWQSYGKCVRTGDVVDLEREFHGGTNEEAARRLLDVSVQPNNIIAFPVAARVVQTKLVPTKDNPLAFPYILPDEEIRDCHRFSVRLLEDRAYMEQVATFRHWQYETVRGLALDGCLGRDDAEHFCFNSAAGCKARWRDGDERRFRFHFGKSWLWRGELIPSADTIYLCEGETDAITLIDTGIEDDGRTVVVGLQGATFNIEPWSFLFADKDVIIATDYDEAGRKAAGNIKRSLAGVASSIKYLRLDKEVLHV